jgi:hypothetical protein
MFYLFIGSKIEGITTMDGLQVLGLIKSLYKELLRANPEGNDRLLDEEYQLLKDLGIDVESVELEVDEEFFGKELKKDGEDLYEDMSFVEPTRERVIHRKVTFGVPWLSLEDMEYELILNKLNDRRKRDKDD